MDKRIILNAIQSALMLLKSEMKCIEDELLEQEYRAVIHELEVALKVLEK